MRNIGTGFWIFIVLLMAGALGYYYYMHERATPAPAQIAPVPDSAESAEPETRYPVPAADPAQPLPALPASDPTFQEGLQALLGEVPLESVLVPRQLIERLVITVDSLDGEALSSRYRAVPKTAGAFAVAGAGESLSLGPDNETRYRGFVSVVQNVDTQQAVALYFRFYPLFQQSYRALGKRGNFNDRLIDIIDHLLAAPQVEGPVLLLKSGEVYRFAYPDLQRRSSGQKILIRVGPSNAAVLKAKLQELRAALVARSHKS